METQLNLKQIKKINPRFFSIMLWDGHGEYPVPTVMGVTQREVYNGYETGQILEEALDLNYLSNETNDLKTKVLTKRYNGEIEHQGPTMAQSIEEHHVDCTLICITFWPERDQNQFDILIKSWLDQFEDEIYKGFNSLGGDDDTFDYFPSFFDMFAQACELLGEPERFETFKNYVGEQEFEFLEDWGF